MKVNRNIEDLHVSSILVQRQPSCFDGGPTEEETAASGCEVAGKTKAVDRSIVPDVAQQLLQQVGKSVLSLMQSTATETVK